MSAPSEAACPMHAGPVRPNPSCGASPLPGARGLPGIGVIHPFVFKGLLRTFTDYAGRFGPCYGVGLPFGHRAVVLAHPDGVERVLRGNRDNYPKGSVYDGARLLLGNGLVTSEGASWARQRRLAQPAFKNESLGNYLPVMAASTQRLLRTWRRHPTGEPIDLHQGMTNLTLEIVGHTLFGMDLSHQVRRESRSGGPRVCRSPSGCPPRATCASAEPCSSWTTWCTRSSGGFAIGRRKGRAGRCLVHSCRPATPRPGNG